MASCFPTGSVFLYCKGTPSREEQKTSFSIITTFETALSGWEWEYLLNWLPRVRVVNRTNAKSRTNEPFAAVLFCVKHFYYFFLFYPRLQGIWQKNQEEKGFKNVYNREKNFKKNIFFFRPFIDRHFIWQWTIFAEF